MFVVIGLELFYEFIAFCLRSGFLVALREIIENRACKDWFGHG